MTTTSAPQLPPAPTRPAPAAAPHRRYWLPTALSAFAVVLASAALMVVLMHSAQAPGAAVQPSTAAQPPSGDPAAAKAAVCSAFDKASTAANDESNGGGLERARIAFVNGAGLITEAVSENPALDVEIKRRALNIATVYRELAIGATADDISRANSVSAEMRESCG